MPLVGVNWPNSSKLGRGLIHSSCNPQVKSQPHWEFYHCLQKKKDFNLCVSHLVNLLTAKDLCSASPPLQEGWGSDCFMNWKCGTSFLEKNVKNLLNKALSNCSRFWGFFSQILLKTAELPNFQIQTRWKLQVLTCFLRRLWVWVQPMATNYVFSCSHGRQLSYC